MNVPNIETATSPATILVVEHDVQLRLLISDGLRSAGFQVIEAVTTDEALTYLRTPQSVSLVFSDISVPGKVDGIGLARAVQQDFPALRIILASGDRSREVPPGIPVLPKPYILARAISEIRTFLQREPKSS